MKAKKIIGGILAAALTVGCVFSCACAPKGGGNVVDDLEGNLTYDEFGDPVFKNKVNLNVWSIIGDPDDKYLDKVNKAFNDRYKDSGISATIVEKDNATFYTSLANTINTDPESAPDVIIYHSERLNMLAHDSVIRPMDEYFDVLNSSAYGEVTPFAKTNYLSNLVQECTYNNKLYGVPLDVHPGIWYVREDILKENGLTKPTCLSEIVSVCNALIEKNKAGTLKTRAMDKLNPAKQGWTTEAFKGKDYCPIIMSEQGGMETGWIPQTAVFQNGGALAGADGKPTWNTQGLEDVLQMFRDWQTGNNSDTALKDKNGNNKFTYSGKFIADDNTSDIWTKLASGEAIFGFQGTWFIESKFDEFNDALGTDPYEALGLMNLSKTLALDEDAECASDVYGVGHCFSISRTVTSKTRCVAAAIYSQYMTENSWEYTDGGHLPASKAVLNSQRLKDRPYYQKYLTEFGDPESLRMLGNTPHYKETYVTLKEVYKDVFTSTKKNISVHNIVSSRFNEAMQSIKDGEDL